MNNYVQFVSAFSAIIILLVLYIMYIVVVGVKNWVKKTFLCESHKVIYPSLTAAAVL